MVADSQCALEREVQRIYDEANAYADHHGGVCYGMNILYGPPILRPKVMIVSIQGGGKDRKPPQTKWPLELTYRKQGHPSRGNRRSDFGSKLVTDFERAGLAHVLNSNAVATNIAFPQAPKYDEWLRIQGAKEWLQKSSEWVVELVELTAPKAILTYGAEPFKRLVGRKKNGVVEETTTKNTTPLVGCHHLAAWGLKLVERDHAIARLKKLIGC